MSFDSIKKMRELELETEEEVEVNSSSDEDGDICDTEEIERIFVNAISIAEYPIAFNKKYILNISASLVNDPNVVVSLSDNTCEVYNLSNQQFSKVTTFTEHTDVITEVIFNRENSNLIYTGSRDGCVKLWDLRIPLKSTVQFKDTTVENGSVKEINCFDISSNNLLLAAGTNLYEGDAFILFWDVRKYNLLGGYWESHTDDITQVKFHPNDPNKLTSGSTDGLINLYDLSESKEEDALIDTLNTESSIEKLGWLFHDRKYILSCITHTADVQFWKLEDAEPYYHLHREEIAKEIKRKSGGHIYVVNVHGTSNSSLILAGSNYKDGQCFRGLSIVGNTVTPTFSFTENQQRVRASWFNSNLNFLLTGGEKGILNAWKIVR